MLLAAAPAQSSGPEPESAPAKTPATAAEISNGRYIGSGALSTFIGFGIGQHVQHRSQHRIGAIFSIGEPVALGIALTTAFCGQTLMDEIRVVGSTRKGGFVGAAVPSRTQPDCSGEQLASKAAFGSYVGLRLWEIYDVWAYPTRKADHWRVDADSTTTIDLVSIPDAGHLSPDPAIALSLAL